MDRPDKSTSGVLSQTDSGTTATSRPTLLTSAPSGRGPEALAHDKMPNANIGEVRRALNRLERRGYARGRDGGAAEGCAWSVRRESMTRKSLQARFRNEVSLHEAGHAVTAWALGFRIDVMQFVNAGSNAPSARPSRTLR